MENDTQESLRVIKHFDLFAEKSVKAKANKTEKKLAKRLGGRRQVMSGALPGMGGDVELPKFLIDSKETTASSFSVKKEDLTKITVEAHSSGKSPALAISFDSMPFEVSKSWILIPEDVFQELSNGD